MTQFYSTAMDNTPVLEREGPVYDLIREREKLRKEGLLRPFNERDGDGRPWYEDYKI